MYVLYIDTDYYDVDQAQAIYDVVSRQLRRDVIMLPCHTYLVEANKEGLLAIKTMVDYGINRLEKNGQIQLGT